MIRKIKANGIDEIKFLKELGERNVETDKKITEIVSDIIENVRKNGDKAVNDYTLKFDGSLPQYYEVPADVISDALTNADPDFINALLNAKENIADFHNRQKEEGFINAKDNGVILGQRIRGLERVGLYVPGGTAAYPSSVLMNAVPAKIAGVNEIIMVTPPLKDGTPNMDILVAAAICGVDRVFMVGGAQAVAALAYGTEQIPKVDKIVGPGNIFVATAKKLLYGTVDIDMIAGPSEILVVADSLSNPKFVAADLLSQAEHDRMASAVLVTDSYDFALKVSEELEVQIPLLPRAEIARTSIDNNGKIIVAENNLSLAIDIANEIAPEHLELCMDNPFDYLDKIKHAGSIFMGRYCPEALGDYFAGPNHTLPTSGTARFSSPLSVDDFVKKTQFTYYTKDALSNVYEKVAFFANKEGLDAHAKSATVRFEEETK